ncbi:MAG: PcfJ domain-containing protein [Clostridia bacterium]|nr:PcfJ domain-containing protein [Clostridia bacterium]
MPEIYIGEQVMNKQGEIGELVAADERYVSVDFSGRVTKFQRTAFEQGFLRYLNPERQNEVVESIARAQEEAARQEEQKRAQKEAAHQAAQPRARRSTARPTSEYYYELLGRPLHGTHPTIQPDPDVYYVAISTRLDPAPLTFNKVRKGDKDLLQAVFTACEAETQALFERFAPKMRYTKYTSYSRDKYMVGFVTKYLDTYMLRVFSRNDIYQKRVRDGVTVIESDTTEILRLVQINGRVYCLSKNLHGAHNAYAYNNWHVSEMGYGILLNRIVRFCDCAYLNDYIEDQDISCLSYANLLFPALHNNKAEIVFKHKLFASAYRIGNLAEYLESFTSKQIDFACKQDALNCLPLIQQCGVRDPELMQKLEPAMIRRRFSRSVYDTLVDTLAQMHPDCDDVAKRFVDFVRRADRFEAAMYYDYINLLRRRPESTLHDFFDNHYLERHDVLLQEVTPVSKEEAEKYKQVAQELSWIDRQENGYYISVPKTITEFRWEGAEQHNCVYTSGYFKLVISRESIIVFLRKDPNVSFVTIEYDYETFAVRQAYGKFNSRIDPDLYDYVVRLGRQLSAEQFDQD